MAVHLFFTKLLYDTAESKDYHIVNKNLGIDTIQKTWTVAVLYAEYPDSVENTNGRPMAAKWIISEIPVYIIEIDRNRYAIIINSGDPVMIDGVSTKVKASYTANKEKRIILGIGNIYVGLEQINRSYREALNAVNYSFNTSDCTDIVVYYRNIEKDRSASYRISQEVENELQKLLRSGDYTAVKEYLDPYMDSHIRNAGIGQASIQFFFYNLLSIAMKAVSDSEMSMSAIIDEHGLMTMKTIIDMKNYIGNVYMMVCESIRTEKYRRSQRVRTDILKFIDENCLDDKLTLQSLADIFGVTVPYLSKFVKDHTGNNFLDYIARMRIHIAKEMLCSGKYSIQQVGEQVGYLNTLTFRRVFRKIEGVNPGDYRESKLS